MHCGAPPFPAIYARFVCILLLTQATVLAQQTSLTNAADVISLPPERAALSLRASVKGVVTAADPVLKGRFFIQDATGGVFVDNFNGRRPEPGEVLEVDGITHPGAYAPIITAPQLHQLGTAPLPTAHRINVERLVSGAEDSQRIEISGLVRDARTDSGRLAVDLVSGGYRFRAYVPMTNDMDPQRFIAAEVRVRGTASESHNRSLRQFISPAIYVPIPGDFVVEKPEQRDPFQEPLIPLKSIAQYHRDNLISQRVHVQGVVTLQRLGEGLFLHDDTGGLRVQSRQLAAFQQGEVIEAVGFLGFEGYLPVLEDAEFRKTAQPSVAVRPVRTTIGRIIGGLHHADFVSLNGKLMDRTVRALPFNQNETERTRVTLVLQNSNTLFTAESDEEARHGNLQMIPIGSTVSVAGICVTEINSDGEVGSFRVLLGAPDAVRVLKTPSWLTPEHLLAGLAATVVILVLVASWSVMVSKNNLALKVLVREKEEAQVELQRAHDELEDRVRERSAQLQFQISARREAQLQFKAVLAERTRLAQELHDTLEQTLTGIALQMDAASKAMESEPTGADRFLELARNMVTQGQVEVRRSVWDLRSRALEQFDLPSALETSAKELTNGTGINATVEAKGLVRSLPEIVEDNILRIAQESLTNAVKHSGGKRITVLLDYRPDSIGLQVADNGRGFSTENCLGPADGHFGLLGIRERVTRLQGKFSLTNLGGEGTVVQVDIPIESKPEMRPPATEVDGQA